MAPPGFRPSAHYHRSPRIERQIQSRRRSPTLCPAKGQGPGGSGANRGAQGAHTSGPGPQGFSEPVPLPRVSPACPAGLLLSAACISHAPRWPWRGRPSRDHGRPCSGVHAACCGLRGQLRTAPVLPEGSLRAVSELGVPLLSSLEKGIPAPPRSTCWAHGQNDPRSLCKRLQGFKAGPALRLSGVCTGAACTCA